MIENDFVTRRRRRKPRRRVNKAKSFRQNTARGLDRAHARKKWVAGGLINAETVVAAAADDGRVTGWDLRSGARAWSIEAHADGAQSCAFRPGDAAFVLTAGADRACKLWDLRSSSKPVRAFDQHHRTDARRRAMHHPAWLSSTTFAVGGEGSERLAFYDATTGALTASLALGADATAVARVDAATVAVATEACDGVSLHAVA